MSLLIFLTFVSMAGYIFYKNPIIEKKDGVINIKFDYKRVFEYIKNILD